MRQNMECLKPGIPQLLIDCYGIPGFSRSGSSWLFFNLLYKLFISDSVI